MALRRYIEHEDKYGTTHRIEIHQDGFAGTASAIRGGEGECGVLEHEEVTDTSDFLNIYANPIQKGTFDAYILVQDDADFTLLTDILAGDENEFSIIYKQGGSVFWQGSVLNDLVEYPESPYPFTARITAKDFSRLKGMDYEPSGSLPDNRQTLITTIAELLDYLGLGLNIETVTSWTEQNLDASLTGSYDFLNEIYHETYILRNFAKAGGEEDEPISVYEALERVLSDNRLVLRQVGGKYVVTQFSEYDTPSSVFVATYNSSGVQQSTASEDRRVTYDRETMRVKTDGSKTQGFPALKEARVKFNHRTQVSELKVPGNVFVSGAGNESFTNSFISNGSQQIKLFGTVQAEYSGDHTSGYAEVMIRVGQYYFDGNNWTTNSADTVTVDLNGFGVQRQDDDGSYYFYQGPLSVTTPVVPADATTPIEIRFYNAVIEAGPDVAADETGYVSLSFEIINPGVDDADTKSLDFKLTQSGGYSMRLDLGETWYGDGPTTGARSALRFSSSSNDITSNTWGRRGDSTYRAFHENYLKESMDLQRSITNPTAAVMWGAYDPESVLVYRSANYVYTGGTLSVKEGDWNPKLLPVSVETGTDTFEKIPRYSEDGIATNATGGGGSGGLDQSTADNRYFRQANNLSEGNADTIIDNIGALKDDFSNVSDWTPADARYFEESKLLSEVGASDQNTVLSNLGITATNTELNRLDGTLATVRSNLGLTDGSAALDIASLDVRGPINMVSSSAIQDAGSNAIEFDGAGNVTIPGNFEVLGSTQSANVTNIDVDDPLMKLADGNTTDAVDIGFVGQRGSNNVGLIWDESADEFSTILTTDDATTAGNIIITDYANLHAGAAVFEETLDVSGTGAFGGLTTHQNGIDVTSGNVGTDNFTSSWAGTGWQGTYGADWEMQNLRVRGALRVYEFIAKQLSSIGGTEILSIANAKIESVDTANSIITVDNVSGTPRTPFKVDDLWIVQVVNINNDLQSGGTGSIVYRVHGKVTATAATDATLDGDQIKVSVDASSPNGLSALEKQDLIVAYGSASNANRQAIMYRNVDRSEDNLIMRLQTGVSAFTDLQAVANTRVAYGDLNGYSGLSSETFGFFAGQNGSSHILATNAGVFLKEGSTVSARLTGAGLEILSGSGISNLSDAGALATANAADWSTQVTGTGKPADNADVTANNTSADTSNVNGVAASAVSGGAQRANAGLDNSGNVARILSGANITAGTVGSAGLYLTATNLGYYNGTSWAAYIENDGSFFFQDASGKGISYDAGVSNFAIDVDIFTLTAGASDYWRTDTGVFSAGGGVLTADRDANSATLAGWAATGSVLQSLDGSGGGLKLDSFDQTLRMYRTSDGLEALQVNPNGAIQTPTASDQTFTGSSTNAYATATQDSTSGNETASDTSDIITGFDDEKAIIISYTVSITDPHYNDKQITLQGRTSDASAWEDVRDLPLADTNISANVVGYEDLRLYVEISGFLGPNETFEINVTSISFEQYKPRMTLNESGLFLAVSPSIVLSMASGGGTVSVSGGGGAVNSVFGRTGQVIAQSGDYSFSQISGTLTDGQMPASYSDTQWDAAYTHSQVTTGNPHSISYGDLQGSINRVGFANTEFTDTPALHTLGYDRSEGFAFYSDFPSSGWKKIWSELDFHPSNFANASHSHAAADLPATIMYEGENVSLLNNDAGYYQAGDSPSFSSVDASDSNINIDTYNSGAYWSTHFGTETTEGTKPSSYSVVVNLGSSYSNGGIQIGSGFAVGDNFYLRRRSDNSEAPNGVGWQPWYTIWHSGNLTTSRMNQWDYAYNNVITGVSGSGNSTLTLTQQDAGTLTADLSHSHAAADLPATIMYEGENVSLLNNDAGYYNAGDNVSFGTGTFGGLTTHQGGIDVTGGNVNITDSTKGYTLKSPTGNQRFGLKYGSAGNVGDGDDLMLTNREANGNVLIAANSGTGGNETLIATFRHNEMELSDTLTGVDADFSSSLSANTLRTDTGKFLSPTSYQFRNAGDTGFRDVEMAGLIATTGTFGGAVTTNALNVEHAQAGNSHIGHSNGDFYLSFASTRKGVIRSYDGTSYTNLAEISSSGLDVVGTITAPAINTERLETTIFHYDEITATGKRSFIQNGGTVESVSGNQITLDNPSIDDGAPIIVSGFNSSGFATIQATVTAKSGSTYTLDATYSAIEVGMSAVQANGDMIGLDASGSVPFIAGYDNVSGFADSPLLGNGTPNWTISQEYIEAAGIFTANGRTGAGELASWNFDSSKLYNYNADGGIELNATSKYMKMYEDNGATARVTISGDNSGAVALPTTATVRDSISGANVATTAELTIVDYETITGSYQIEETAGSGVNTYEYTLTFEGWNGSSWIEINAINGTGAGSSTQITRYFSIQDKTGYTKFRLVIVDRNSSGGTWQFNSYSVEQKKSEVYMSPRGTSILGGLFYLDIPKNDDLTFNLDEVPSGAVFSDEQDSNGNWIVKVKN